MSKPIESDDVKSPIGFVVGISLCLVTLLLTITLAIAGSYALTIHTIDQAKAQEQALQAREAESGLRTSVPLCKAIIEMDNASHGAVNASNSPNSYGHRLARAIHDVTVRSRCEQLVNDLNMGMSYKQILVQMERENETPNG